MDAHENVVPLSILETSTEPSTPIRSGLAADHDDANITRSAPQVRLPKTDLSKVFNRFNNILPSETPRIRLDRLSRRNLVRRMSLHAKVALEMSPYVSPRKITPRRKRRRSSILPHDSNYEGPITIEFLRLFCQKVVEEKERPEKRQTAERVLTPLVLPKRGEFDFSLPLPQTDPGQYSEVEYDDINPFLNQNKSDVDSDSLSIYGFEHTSDKKTPPQQLKQVEQERPLSYLERILAAQASKTRREVIESSPKTPSNNQPVSDLIIQDISIATSKLLGPESPPDKLAESPPTHWQLQKEVSLEPTSQHSDSLFEPNAPISPLDRIDPIDFDQDEIEEDSRIGPDSDDIIRGTSLISESDKLSSSRLGDPLVVEPDTLPHPDPLISDAMRSDAIELHADPIEEQIFEDEKQIGDDQDSVDKNGIQGPEQKDVEGESTNQQDSDISDSLQKVDDDEFRQDMDLDDDEFANGLPDIDVGEVELADSDENTFIRNEYILQDNETSVLGDLVSKNSLEPEDLHTQDPNTQTHSEPRIISTIQQPNTIDKSGTSIQIGVIRNIMRKIIKTSAGEAGTQVKPVSSEVYSYLQEISDSFLESTMTDLEAYSQHRTNGRSQQINVKDVLLLMKRTKFIPRSSQNSKQEDINAISRLAHNFLPLELLLGLENSITRTTKKPRSQMDDD